MTFLPIVERELRVAARKRSTFWLRVSAALVGLVIGSGFMFISVVGGMPPPIMGDALFGTLTWLSLFAALAAGLFFTSDCLSEEKREGTLGFLFLTDLRGYDVVGGKLLATSLRVAYGLMAVIPILAVSFLLGAVSSAQYWKTALALLNALFCSLAAGLLVSALSRDSQRAMGATVFLLLLLVLGGPAADGIYSEMRGRVFKPVLSLASAGFTFMQAGAWGRNPYWRALGISHAVAWAMLLLACLLAPRTWQERSRRPKASHLDFWWKYGSRRRRRRLRRKLLDRNPVMWLACRERWQAVGVWMLTLVVSGLHVGFIVGKVPAEVWQVWSVMSWLVIALLYLWVASQAGRFFIDARRSGLIELLLAAPLRVRDVVRGHWAACMRLFAPPVALLLLVQLLGGCVAYAATWRGPAMSAMGGTQLIGLIASGAGTLSTVASLLALVWFGMWMGMTSRNASLSTLKTILFVKIIPSLIIYFATALILMALTIPRAMRAPGATTFAMTPAVTLLVTACIPAALNIVLAAVLIIWSRDRLYSMFREWAARGLRSVPVQAHLVLPTPIPTPPVIPSLGAPASLPASESVAPSAYNTPGTPGSPPAPTPPPTTDQRNL